MSKNLLPQLDLQDPNSVEVRLVLQQEYGPPSILGRGLTYPGSTLDYAVRLFHEGDRVTRLETGPRFSPVAFARVKDLVQRLLIESPGQVIARSIGLSTPWPIVGVYRSSSGKFQLIPAPDYAARPSALLGQHPILLEFPIRRSVDPQITHVRRHRRDHEISLVLSALLRGKLISTINPRPRHEWVMSLEDWNDPSSPYKLTWAQVGYQLFPFELYQDEFSQVDGPEVPLAPHDEYYSKRFQATLDQINFPLSLSEMFDTYDELSPEEQQQYLRAARWVQIAADTWDSQISPWYTGLMSAIETMAPTPTEKCPECGTMVGIAKGIREFLKDYAPNSDPKMRTVVYKYRSKISHGSQLMHLDESPWDRAILHAGWLDERAAMEALHHMTQEMMVNWLRLAPRRRATRTTG